MLTRLLIRNFLLVREAELIFGPGLNVLTGETGAGKSILLGALDLVLGARGKQGIVGPAGDELLLEAVFHCDKRLIAQLREIGIQPDGKELILTRRLRTKGDSRCFINGQQVVQRQLRQIRGSLVEIHGQRQEERFRTTEVQRDLLDLFADHGPDRKALQALYRDVTDSRQKRDLFAEELARLAREEEWLRYQLAEIEALAPQPDELQKLRDEISSLSRAREEAEFLTLAEQILNGPQGGALELLETLADRSGSLPDSSEWSDIREKVRGLRNDAYAIYREIGDKQKHLSDGLADLPKLESRSSQLEALCRKHKKDLGEIINAGEQMRESLDQLALGEAEAINLTSDVTEAETRYLTAARQLSASRSKEAVKFASAVEKEVSALGMKGFGLDIQVAALSDDGPIGIDRVQFLAQTNPGSTYQPFGDIASGGELARVALALRVVLGKRGRAKLTVFDEIDAGLGATAAKNVSQRLQAVARHRQVLLVTHLPVIAAGAEKHLRVEKQTTGKQTVSQVVSLAGEERVQEIARMLGGDASDQQALQHAASLLHSR
jgi:DNA repair protein RecN (Recombination protein N)